MEIGDFRVLTDIYYGKDEQGVWKVEGHLYVEIYDTEDKVWRQKSFSVVFIDPDIDKAGAQVSYYLFSNLAEAEASFKSWDVVVKH